MKEGSEHFGCILYLSSFSSEYTWVLLNGPNGHWVTPGQPSNTLFKSHNTHAQDLWTKGSDGSLYYSNLQLYWGGGPSPHYKKFASRMKNALKKGGIFGFLSLLYFLCSLCQLDHISEDMGCFFYIWDIIGAKIVSQKVPFSWFGLIFKVFGSISSKKRIIFKFVCFVIWHMTLKLINKQKNVDLRAHKLENEFFFHSGSFS